MAINEISQQNESVMRRRRMKRTVTLLTHGSQGDVPEDDDDEEHTAQQVCAAPAGETKERFSALAADGDLFSDTTRLTFGRQVHMCASRDSVGNSICFFDRPPLASSEITITILLIRMDQASNQASFPLL